MEHVNIKNGTFVEYTKGDYTRHGRIRSYNPAGHGIFTVDLAGQRHPVYLYESEFVIVEDPEVIKKQKLKRAEELILEAACENPLTSNGPYVLVDRHATKFMNALHKALLELTAE